MKMKYLMIGGIAVSLMLGGCASSPQTPQEQAVQDVIDNVPDWYVDLPKSDDEDNRVLYVAGTGKSMNMPLARDKAILDAEKQLANKINAKISSRFKQYIREVGAGTPLTIEDNEIVTKKLVAEANVAGYKVLEAPVLRERDQYRFYVLLEYPIDDNTLRAIAQTEELIKRFKGDKEKAFKELDREIDANREMAPLHDTPVAPDVNARNEIEENIIYNDENFVQTFPL